MLGSILGPPFFGNSLVVFEPEASANEVSGAC